MRQSVIQRAYDADNVLLTCDADEKDYAFSKSRLAWSIASFLFAPDLLMAFQLSSKLS